MQRPTEEITEEERAAQAAEQEKLINEAKKKINDVNNGEMNRKVQEMQQAQAAQSPNSVAGHWNKVFKPRFEIELYDEVTSDETGEPTGQWKKVVTDQPIIIEAASKADLAEHAQRFAILHQRMKVVRKVSDGQIPQDAVQKDTTSAKPKEDTSKPKSYAIANDDKHAEAVIDVDASSSKTVVQQKQHEIIREPVIRKPKFYRIGDIEIKDDNGKIYQKQWMKLSSHEAANFRIVNDKNNAIVNLTGKSIEMKRWVLVEKTDDETTSLEEQLNG